jgi:hypothetical protein
VSQPGSDDPLTRSTPSGSDPAGHQAGTPSALTDELVARRHRAHRMAWLYTAAAAALLPWIVYLAVTLPKRSLDHHYRAAWVGFDVFLVVVIVRTAYFAFRVDQRVQFAATATATLLFVDAWFDVTTSSGRGQVLEALLLAILVEIPAAIFSLYLARQVNLRVLESADLEHSPFGSAGQRQIRRWRRHHPLD